MKQIAAREAVSLLKTMTRVLCAVGILALIFTTVNVTRFATSRDVPLPIAILLDPMIGTALAGVLYVDARLASWGVSPPAWSTTLRWGAGCTAALMNSWESLWPDGQIGWPRRADPAAVLLHLAPALLLIALTETIAAYRRTVTDLLDRIDTDDRTEHDTATAQQPCPPLNDRETAPTADRSGPDADSGDTQPPPRHPADVDRDMWTRAIELDDRNRAATGTTVTVWRLRQELRIGPRRAARIHERLADRRPIGTDHPPTDRPL
ncbi:extensin [Streptomyces sp. NPDC019645]|uniref:extensin n=1 Tax=unclassified Streptomyces TaxID=2593676 RepID=UPI00301504C4